MTAPADFNTAARIIRFAMEDAGLLEGGSTPTSLQYARYLPRLNDLINQWQTSGLKLWLLEDTPIPLVAGQGTYTLSPTGDVVMPKPLRVIDAYYLDVNGIRRPLIPLSWADYTRLSQINSQGQINSYFVNKKQSELSVFFWLLPDATAATGTAHLLLQTQVTNLVSLTDAMAFPQEWFIALRWGLADEICTGQPQSIVDRCAKRAAFYRSALEDWDVEDAPTSFAPDQRSGYASSSFR